MNWNTITIVENLKIGLNAKGINAKVTVHDPGGDYDTKEIRIAPASEVTDCICISGYNTDFDMDATDPANPSHDIEYVEICNRHSDSDGGLSHMASDVIRACYFVAIDFFRDNVVQIIRTHKQIF